MSVKNPNLHQEKLKPFLSFDTYDRMSPQFFQQYTEIFNSISPTSKCQLSPIDVQIARTPEEIKSKVNKMFVSERGENMLKRKQIRKSLKIQEISKKSESKRVISRIKSPQSSDISYKLGNKKFKFTVQEKNNVLQQCDDFLQSIGFKQQKPTFYLPSTIEKLEQLKEQLSPSCFNNCNSIKNSEYFLKRFQQFDLINFKPESQQSNYGTLGPPTHRKEVYILQDWLQSILVLISNQVKETFKKFELTHTVYQISLREIIRQVSVICIDRGIILEKIFSSYENTLRGFIKQYEKQLKVYQDQYEEKVEILKKEFAQNIDQKNNQLSNQLQKIEELNTLLAEEKTEKQRNHLQLETSKLKVASQQNMINDLEKLIRKLQVQVKKKESQSNMKFVKGNFWVQGKQSLQKILSQELKNSWLNNIQLKQLKRNANNTVNFCESEASENSYLDKSVQYSQISQKNQNIQTQASLDNILNESNYFTSKIEIKTDHNQQASQGNWTQNDQIKIISQINSSDSEIRNQESFISTIQLNQNEEQKEKGLSVQQDSFDCKQLNKNESQGCIKRSTSALSLDSSFQKMKLNNTMQEKKESQFIFNRKQNSLSLGIYDLLDLGESFLNSQSYNKKKLLNSQISNLPLLFHVWKKIKKIISNNETVNQKKRENIHLNSKNEVSQKGSDEKQNLLKVNQINQIFKALINDTMKKIKKSKDERKLYARCQCKKGTEETKNKSQYNRKNLRQQFKEKLQFYQNQDKSNRIKKKQPLESN